MLNFFKKPKKKGNGSSKTAEDPTSIGSILLRHGFVTAESLVVASQFQKEHGDICMGYALVELNRIQSSDLELAKHEQDMIRQAAKSKTLKSAQECVRIATKATRGIQQSVDSLSKMMSLQLELEEK